MATASEKMKVSEDDLRAQREVIGGALRRLGQEANNQGFTRLGEETGLAANTLYQAFNGRSRLRKGLHPLLQKVGSPAPDAAPDDDTNRRISIIFQRGTPETVRAFRLVVQSLSDAVA